MSEIPDSCGFHGWKCFPMKNSCSEHPHEAFKPWIFGFWVGLHDLGLGFTNVRERRKSKRRRKRNIFKKWANRVANPFYTSLWTGLIQTRSTLSCSQPFDSDPDGSGSIQRSWSVSLIRIHQIRGFGPLTHKHLALFQFLVFSCYLHLFSCYLNLYAC